jgi:hypothetical protein
MRPSRVLVLGLAGLVGLHVFMLAGHGSPNAPIAVSRVGESPMGTAPVGVHASHSASPSPVPAALPRGGHDDAGMAMTVACLAVLAGWLLLPGRTSRRATASPRLPAGIWQPVRAALAGAPAPSLAELCISLT